MKIEKPANLNYAAQVIRIPALVELQGLDNLVGVPVLGHQALTQKDGKQVGDLVIAFTAETQLSDDYGYQNSLFRHSDKNKDESEKGYLEDNARVKALRLRKHTSNALLMPLESVAYTGVDLSLLTEGTVFDRLNGHEICRKYLIVNKQAGGPSSSKVDRAFKRVDKKVFPEHLETDNYWRSKHLLKNGAEVIVTQKLHGTSFRAGNVPVRRQLKWYHKALRKLGIAVATWEFDVVYGSRKVIKDVNNPNQQHFYQTDIWTEYGQRIADLIPAGYIVYGELIGWTPDGTPIQKNYTYDLPHGECELYVYRVAHVNVDGVLSDLSWDGVVEFCKYRGLKWTPELCRVHPGPAFLDRIIDEVMDERIAGLAPQDWLQTPGWKDDPVIVSSHKTVDEGVCIRQEGFVPTILKAKSPKFLEHETKLLDSGEQDLESLEAVA